MGLVRSRVCPPAANGGDNGSPPGDADDAALSQSVTVTESEPEAWLRSSPQTI